MSTWRNWSGEQAFTPARFATPRSTEEVAQEVRKAGEAHQVVRVAGAGHSFTDAVVTDGTLLSLDAMDRIVDVEAATGLVRVQAGIRLHALSDGLAERGLALENLGDVDVQSLAGATATGTHGTGAKLRNVSAGIEAVQIVAGDGTVHELDAGDDLLAARVSIGALGVVTEVTLRTVPLYTLRGVDEPRPLSEVIEHLDVLADGSRHFELFTFPHTDIALTRTNEIVDEAPQPPSRLRRTLEDDLVTNLGLGVASRAGRRMPRQIPRINRAIASSFGKRVRVDRSDRIFASPRRVRFVETELGFPRRVARDVLAEVLDAARRHPVNFPIEVRFVAADEALLSPSSGRDTVYLAAHVYRGMAWEPFFRAVHAIGERHAARPHWGKRHFHTAATLSERYPGWERFQAVRGRLDPDGRFANAYVRRTLGPPA